MNALHKNCVDLSTAATILGAAETGAVEDITVSDMKMYKKNFSKLESWLKEQPDQLLNIFEPYLKLKH